MVQIFIHHGGQLSQRLGVYNGIAVDNIGNHDLDYLSVVVLKKFVNNSMGYRNVKHFAYKFSHYDVMLFTHLQTNDDVRELLKILVQQPKKELHLYVVHSVDIPELVEEDHVEDIYGEGAFHGGIDRDEDQMGGEESDAYDLNANQEDGEDDMFKFSGDGEEGDNEVDRDAEGVDEALLLSNFKGSDGEEQQELYPDLNIRDDETRERENDGASTTTASQPSSSKRKKKQARGTTIGDHPERVTSRRAKGVEHELRAVMLVFIVFWK
ncbi:hypothetical protein CJ030_MR1G019562 [Morella rubra]|uniref:PB1-like domain-containing protein n=1 Tax=Morella rubra TaxID=262757 RepID=A0A6A1WNX8_9ROSI|nr:hypothetical protein CJ030_MR1G019562 [Morella rubra]